MIQIGDLHNQAVLITGASSGIGAAVALAFARQGARVALHFNSRRAAAEAVARAVREAGGTAELIQGDLAHAGVAQRVVAQAAANLDGLDILINNAGSLVSRRPFLEADDVWIDAIFNLNARAVVAACQAAAPFMRARGGGAIINVGSIAALDGGGGGAGLYAAAKAFVHNLTRHLAREFAPANIRVNTIAPGVIQTPFHAATPPERLETLRNSIPMSRLGTAEDCVGAFLFLASRALSGYVTGQTLHVNGGQVMP